MSSHELNIKENEQQWSEWSRKWSRSGGKKDVIKLILKEMKNILSEYYKWTKTMEKQNRIKHLTKKKVKWAESEKKPQLNNQGNEKN